MLRQSCGNQTLARGSQQKVADQNGMADKIKGGRLVDVKEIEEK
jgi:hypothetical protein